MAIVIEGQVGPQVLQDGTTQAIRMEKTGGLVVQELHGRFYEQTYRQNLYSLTLTATTTGAAAGNLVGAAGAASTQFAIWNPVGNTKNLVLLKVFVGVISGTPPGGPLFHGMFLNGVPTINSTGTALNNYTAGPAPTARFMSSAAGAALTGGGVPTTFRPMTFDFSATAFAAAAGTPAYELIDGDIVIAPGFGWLPLWATAGTTLLNAYGATWEEVPV